MAEYKADPVEIEDRSEGEKSPSSVVRHWLRQIETAKKWHSDWHTQGKKVVDRYLDERESVGRVQHRMNVLWSNTQTISPSLFSRLPNPRVQRRNRDKDAIGRWASIVLERSLAYQIEKGDLENQVKNILNDLLLPGRGVAWVSYKADIEKDEEDEESVAWELTEAKHVNWRDFLTNPARTWDEVEWVAKRAYMDKDSIAKRFGKNIAQKLSFTEQNEAEKTVTAGNTEDERAKLADKTVVWEIWCKTSGKVYFIASCYPDAPLEEPKEPYLELDGFFPVPRPLSATTSTDSILPIPDFCMYQDQAAEIDQLTGRINLLVKAMRVVGIYDASQESLGLLLSSSDENKMVPCENWAVLAGQGGLKGSVDFFPLDQIIKALRECYVSRDQAKATMYEVSGISDIIRGASNPQETATAQSIKSQWGGLRIRDRQKDVQRFIVDILRIQAEIIAEHFSVETLKQMTNVPLFTKAEKEKLQQRQQFAQKAMQMAQANPEQAQALVQQNPQLMELVKPPSSEQLRMLTEPTWEEVMALLRDEKLRGFRVEIETDSTIQADEQEEKKARIEFLQAFGMLLQQMGPMVMAAPEMAPMLGESLLFAVRAFKAGDTLETSIEEAVEGITEKAKTAQGAGPPPDPKVEADKAKLQIEQQKMQMQQQSEQAKLQIEQQKLQLEAQASQQRLEIENKRAEAEQQRVMSEIEIERARLGLDAQKAQTENEMNKSKLDIDRHKALSSTKLEQDRLSHDERARVAPSLDFEAVTNQQMQALATGVQQIMQASMETLMQANMQAMQQMSTQSAQILADGLTAIQQAALAPKEITVERDQYGRIVGGSARPSIGPTRGNA